MTGQAPVCILTAGRGLRMGFQFSSTNKALLPLGDKAVVSHIIDSFPTGTEFVVALGHLAAQVRDYLSMAHPDLNVSFVEVAPFEGEGSGPGYSLWCCRQHLQRPFHFVACDTLFETDLEAAPLINWVGVADVDPKVSADYCNLALENNRVMAIRDKVQCDAGHRAFTGFMFIRDHEIFWQCLNSGDVVSGEWQISNGLQGLMNGPGLEACEGNWVDVGTLEKYHQEVKARTEYNFGKTDELLYFVNKRVIKFFVDRTIVAARVAKARIKPEVFPNIQQSRGQFYCYSFVEGKTLYAYNHPGIFKSLLEWLDQQVWTPVDVEPDRMRSLCEEFYRDKTYKRLVVFDKKYPNYAAPMSVNGETVIPLATLLERIPWDRLFEGRAVFIHGDLQFDNIIYSESTDSFLLLDWRQDFSGEIAFGDQYYDLAKLMGGLILNYDYIKGGLFNFERHGDDDIVDFARRNNCLIYENILASFILDKGLDLERVRLLVALIYLNMATLHHPPFDKALYALGTLFLTRLVNPKNR